MLTINNHRQTDIILLYFTEALNCVSHAKVILKLRAVIGEGPIIAQIKSFLTQRLQYTLRDQHYPIHCHIRGPSGISLTFLIFINDIARSIECNIKLFAYDCIIYKEINRPKVTRNDCRMV